jgi:hypothetical protein
MIPHTSSLHAIGNEKSIYVELVGYGSYEMCVVIFLAAEERLPPLSPLTTMTFDNIALDTIYEEPSYSGVTESRRFSGSIVFAGRTTFLSFHHDDDDLCLSQSVPILGFLSLALVA